MQIGFQHVPLWTVKPERFAGMPVYLHQCHMFESCEF